MRSAKFASAVPETADTEDIFHMTNLSPRMTGLPMSVWVSPSGNARHDLRIKVNMSHGRQMSIDNPAVVALRPQPPVVAGRVSADDQRLVAEWIGVNFAAIMSYWNEELDADSSLNG